MIFIMSIYKHIAPPLSYTVICVFTFIVIFSVGIWTILNSLHFLGEYIRIYDNSWSMSEILSISKQTPTFCLHLRDTQQTSWQPGARVKSCLWCHPGLQHTSATTQNTTGVTGQFFNISYWLYFHVLWEWLITQMFLRLDLPGQCKLCTKTCPVQSPYQVPKAFKYKTKTAIRHLR